MILQKFPGTRSFNLFWYESQLEHLHMIPRSKVGLNLAQIFDLSQNLQTWCNSFFFAFEWRQPGSFIEWIQCNILLLLLLLLSLSSFFFYIKTITGSNYVCQGLSWIYFILLFFLQLARLQEEKNKTKKK